MVNKIERSITWKYFWQQKFKEIYDVFAVVCNFYTFIGWLPGLFGLMVAIEDTPIGSSIIYTGNWWGFIPGALWILFITIELVIIFMDWIKSNWKKAKRRARADIKKTKHDALKNK